MAIMQMVFVTMLIAGCQAKSLVARQGGGNPHNCPEHCPFNIEPVCGSNGVTYDNPCLLEAAACQDATLYSDQWNYKPLTLAHYAPCGTQNRKRQFNPGTDHCQTHCSDHYDPVCGSNHQTYTNRCYLELDACIFSAQHPESHHTITVAYDGACNGVPEKRKRQFDGDCPMFCPEYYSPVCGSNGQIYDNICFLESAACIFSAQHPNSHHTITVADDGSCHNGAFIHDSAAIHDGIIHDGVIQDGIIQDGVIHDGIVHDRAI